MAQDTQHHTLSDRLRNHTANFTRNVGESVHRLGIHPDAVSVAALLLCAGAAVAIGNGRFVLAGWLVFWGGIFDVADGAVARARGQVTSYGAVLDSTLDRYADGFIFFSFGYYFASQNQLAWMLLSFAALMGAYGVSYVRARANGPDVGVAIRSGWFTRFERMVIVMIALWFHHWLLLPGLLLLAAGTHVTVAQRLWIVRKNTTEVK